MINAERFWPEEDSDNQEWVEDFMSLREWRAHRRNSYERGAHEYTQPAKNLLLVDISDARMTSINDGGASKGRSHAWRAVRGTHYTSASNWDIPPGQARSIIVDLVPTPNNPFDSCAVAVEYEGKKLGNVSSRYARYAHWKVRQLNLLGYCAQVPAVYKAFFRSELRQATAEAFVALPALDRLDRLIPSMTEQVRRFRRLWDSLDDELRDEIRTDSYHLTDETTSRLIRRYSRAFPELTLPTQPDASAMPMSLEVALRDARHHDEAVRARESHQAWVKERHAVASLVEERHVGDARNLDSSGGRKVDTQRLESDHFGGLGIDPAAGEGRGAEG
uniref:hypothetical protein n=1 Tax=Agromyces laixinhei TaxID=2585717 RepID=UPI0012EDAB2B